MDTLAAMKLFTKVVERGNFSEAGRDLGMIPSSVSRQIGALEEELGTALFRRTTRRLNLTEAGELYYQNVTRILSDIEETNRNITDLNKEPRGLLRINTAVVFGYLYIAPILSDFLRAYPRIKVELITTDQVVDLVETGTDLAVRFGHMKDSSLKARRLAPHRMIICGSPDYFSHAGRPETPEALSLHNCLTYKRSEGPTTWTMHGSDQTTEVSVSGNFQSNNIEAILVAARKGLGIARLPAWMISDDLRNGILERVFPRHQVLPSDDDPAIYAVYPSNRHPSLKVRVFLDFLVDRINDVSNWD